MTAKISRVFGVLCSGSISALITLCYAIGYGLMIFSDSLERYASVGIPSLLIGVCLVGLVVTLWSSQQFRIAGPDSNTAAILAVSLASIGLDTRAKGGSESAVIGTVLMALSLPATHTIPPRPGSMASPLVVMALNWVRWWLLP